MLPLLLSGALMAGVDTSAGMGETGPSFAAAADARLSVLSVEALAVASPKLESGRGWFATGAAEIHLPGSVIAGVRYSHRDGGDWLKQTWWARLGYGGVRHRVHFERALTGYNEELKLEYRHRAFRKLAALDIRMFVSRHIQGWGFGSSVMAGIGKGE